jgi:hypothetical integral membrane protein (TIGR02206 family)
MSDAVPVGINIVAERFQAFSGTHFALLGLFALGTWFVIVWGRGHRGGSTEQAYRRAFALAVALFAGSLQVYQLTPGDWDLGTSLPLQLCDLAWLAAVIALWTRNPWASAFTYYVGLSITSQGIITPSLAEDFPDPRFFGFWGMHLLVVWAACYLTWGLGLRPTWRSYAFTVAATAVWAVAAYVFNVIANTNYGYLNRKPSSASLLDLLGPWPWYVFAEIAIVFFGWMLIMTLPWVLQAKRTARTR